MSKYKILGCESLSNIPWQQEPSDLGAIPIWRYNDNPIIKRNPIKGVARIFILVNGITFR